MAYEFTPFVRPTKQIPRENPLARIAVSQVVQLNEPREQVKNWILSRMRLGEAFSWIAPRKRKGEPMPTITVRRDK